MKKIFSWIATRGCGQAGDVAQGLKRSAHQRGEPLWCNPHRQRKEKRHEKQRKEKRMKHTSKKQLSIFDVVMPNGKKLGDCTFGEVGEFAESLNPVKLTVMSEREREPILSVIRQMRRVK
jgi:hypothetical protein